MSSPFQCRLRLSRREGRLRELRRGKDVRSLWPAPEAAAAREPAAEAREAPEWRDAAARTSALEDRAAADGEATDGASAADGAAAPRARGDARVVRGGALPRRNGAVLLFLAICIAVLAVAVHACLARSHVGVSTVADEARIFITQPARGQLVTKLRTRLQWSFSDSLTARAQLSVVGMEVWVDDSLFIGGADDPRGRLEMPSWNGVEPFQLALTLNQMQIGLHNVTVVVRSFEAKFSTVTNTTLFVTLPAPSPAT
ncbi:hypothetical protein M885DRAFT_623250 [Pelagophyceae sp. CCMP2097]|nr:hypothetical protein M885DRAFT_623250 [Pelagophyceae sp. CCMP2097]